MKDYYQLLDIRNQKRVDELYEHIKDENKLEIDEAYQKITKRNQSQYQNIRMKMSHYLDLLSHILDIIGMIIFAILFIIGGSFILASLLCLFHSTIDLLAGLYNTICQLGISLYDQTFASFIGLTASQYLEGITNYYMIPKLSSGFYILGLTFILIIIFLIIYIMYFLKKVEPKKKNRILSLEDSLCYLQVDENDSFRYIRFQFLKKFKRRYRDYFEQYYQAYITIFDNYHEIQGSYSDLTSNQKVKIIFFTTINVLKNVLSSFAKPIFFSIVLIIIYWQNFTYTTLFSLEIFLQALPFGSIIVSLLNISYYFVTHTFLYYILININLIFFKNIFI